MYSSTPLVINKTAPGGIKRFVVVVKEVLFSPNSFFAAMKDTTTLPNPYLFLAVCSLIHTLMVVLTLKKISFMLIFLALANGMLMPFVTSWLLFFILTRLFKGVGTYDDSLRINVYAGSTVLFSWIPMGGFLLEIYRLYLISAGLYYVFAVRPVKAWLAIAMTVLVYTLVFSGISQLSAVLGVSIGG